MRVSKIKLPIQEILERLESAFQAVESRFVNRSSEINAVKMCMLTRGHLLIEGPPGTAKSQLARHTFKVIDPGNLVIFSKQFMAHTSSDEVFGPMNIVKLREEAIYEFNTTNMLPQAHFAFLDEIYRASDSLLPSMLGILNERTFYNGAQTTKCPLITAIGTTNFISDRPELEAFHDRWHIRTSSKPADSVEARLRIVELFLEKQSGDFKVDSSLTVKVPELQRIQNAITGVQIPQSFLSLYDALVSAYRNAIGGSCYVSDRRYCEAIRHIQAAIFLDNNGEPCKNPSVKCLLAAIPPLMQANDKTHTDAMDTAVTSVIGDFERSANEEPEIAEIEERANKIIARYDDKMDAANKARMLERIVKILEGIGSLSPEEQFTIPRNVDRLRRVTKKLDELKLTLHAALGITAFS